MNSFFSLFLNNKHKMGCGISKHDDIYGSSESPSYERKRSDSINRQLKSCNSDYERSMMMMHLSMYGA